MSIRSWNDPVAVSAIIITKEAALPAKARLLIACKGREYEIKSSPAARHQSGKFRQTEETVGGPGTGRTASL